jgi:hypothetical protein
MNATVETVRAMITEDVQDRLEEAANAADWDGRLARAGNEQYRLRISEGSCAHRASL